MTGQRDEDEARAEIRASTVSVLDYILKLELTAARWERVAATVELAIEAETAGDLDGLRQASNELELVGPVRIIRIGGTPVVPPPPTVRERVDVLISLARTPDSDPESDKD